MCGLRNYYACYGQLAYRQFSVLAISECVNVLLADGARMIRSFNSSVRDRVAFVNVCFVTVNMLSVPLTFFYLLCVAPAPP